MNENRKALIAVIGLIIIGGLMLVFLPQKDAEPYRKTRLVLDTYVTIAADADEPAAKKAVKMAFERMKEIDDKLNRYSPKSEISKVNREAPKPVKVSSDTLKSVKMGLYYSKISKGSFDITVGPLVSLFDFNKKIVPVRKEVKKAKELVDYRFVKIDEKKSTIALSKKGMILDVGAIAKGLAADEAFKVLKKQGVKGGLIDTGSSALAFSSKEGRKWRVGLRHPRQEEVLTVFDVRNKNISTSGDYQQFFVKNGRRYHHIIDPLTGYPAGGLASVTVISEKSAAQSDIISTAVFAMGKERGLDFVKSLKSTDVVMITTGGRVITTKNVPSKIAKQIKLR